MAASIAFRSVSIQGMAASIAFKPVSIHDMAASILPPGQF